MTTKRDLLRIERKIVLSFDICSSSDILEDLHRTENIKHWRNFLIWIKEYLVKKSRIIGFRLYKFTGDGWIILFEWDHSGYKIMSFLEDICKQFQRKFGNNVEKYLESPPEIVGLTFGMDRGTLVRIKMSGSIEYVGRAINVACRLRGAIKDKDNRPQYKALVTKHLYSSMQKEIPKHKPVEVKRKLRNIAGGKVIRCMKFSLMKNKDKKRKRGQKRIVRKRIGVRPQHLTSGNLDHNEHAPFKL